MNSAGTRPMMAILTAFLTCGALCAAQGISAITDPSADVMLSFLNAGRIATVTAKEGDVVNQGHILARQDDAIEQAQLAQLLADSKDQTQILAAEATLAQKQVDLKRLEWAAQRGAATELEVEHAKLDVLIAQLSLKVAQFDHEQAVRKYETALISVQNMKLVSPIKGTVEQITIEVGESINALEPIIRIVKTNPLWIDAPVPLIKAAQLRIGQTANIRFNGPQAATEQGKIIFIATAADAASSTRRVRIEMPNKTARPAGEHVIVSFADGVAAEKVQYDTTATPTKK